MADTAGRTQISRTTGFLVALLLGLLAGCSTSGTGRPAPPISQPVNPVQADVLFQTMSLLGTPYRYGGNSPDTGFDCSGLIHYVYRKAAGIDLPRTTAKLNALRTDKPPADALQPGDLLLFKVKGSRKVNHAGIYVGDGRFVHAPSSGGRVRLDRLDDRYWLRGYTGARRVLN
jgi:cell wall-associated NlpC family hydrolase